MCTRKSTIGSRFCHSSSSDFGRYVPLTASDIECPMKRAGVHDRFAHVANAHLIAASVLDRESDAGAHRHVRADDAMAAKKIQVPVEEMHRPALAMRASGGAPEQLSHYRPR